MSNTKQRRSTLEKQKGVTILKASHPTIKKLMNTVDEHTHHGHRVWNTSLILMDYFEKKPLPFGCRVLEIGCGWGITGIYLAKKYSCDLTALDIDKNVFPFLHTHAEINNVDIETIKGSYDRLSVDFLKSFDVIIGGDICFWDELSEKLFKLIRRAMKAKTRVVLCDPGRHPFYRLVDRCQKDFQTRYQHKQLQRPRPCQGYVLDVENC